MAMATATVMDIMKVTRNLVVKDGWNGSKTFSENLEGNDT
jgi:hypothetical protein